ncbi:hypothetical protein AAZX31_08G340700 [Glycine max]|nr:uncharacterized protein LOC100776257 isoform X2 [Glycine max]XP_006586231.1 uncharacterized protein LOC100776257 isoform X2 [Glycine max]XP_014634981.1 uncharacterized protein LOC100776257 isoform X2 [Glycine max]XP_028246388.1 uncharacterized protein LOC114423729 isoform X2 [Glycine soja]XP_028246389.1 uncharacterized protein LOC114423729 isoform X2 [Glycine soja]KAG5017827.1 hypothetical protein JHK85_023963 [Glycine max]KAH1054583.1 hypothetical protein GYH30_023396 [Glycine max]KAH105|eukprot:XP_006586230.1 uncharacterized protein LOC100776257 isoform X2 [Glycine max]
MSASDNSRARELAGLTLDDVLGNQKRPSSTPPSQQLPKSRTLLDIIKEDESNKKDRRSWKAFKDKLRLKRAGSAWTSTIHIPTSDVPIPNPNSRIFTQFGHRNSVQSPTQTLTLTHSDSDMSTPYDARQVEDLDPAAADDSGYPATMPPAVRPQFSRRGSTRFDGDPSGENTAGTLRPQLSRRNSTNMPSEPYKRGRVVTFRDTFDDEDDGGEKPGEGRALSAREAVAAQEAAEAAAQEAEEAEEQAPVMMSLMDLLEETDREMGLEGSRYILSDDDEDEDEDDDGGEGSMEHTCCVCMVRHKAAAFIPCGHTFCRMCSRELMVSRGNCPRCNNFILEILDIF